MKTWKHNDRVRIALTRETNNPEIAKLRDSRAVGTVRVLPETAHTPIYYVGFNGDNLNSMYAFLASELVAEHAGLADEQLTVVNDLPIPVSEVTREMLPPFAPSADDYANALALIERLTSELETVKAALKPLADACEAHQSLWEEQCDTVIGSERYTQLETELEEAATKAIQGAWQVVRAGQLDTADLALSALMNTRAAAPATLTLEDVETELEALWGDHDC